MDEEIWLVWKDTRNQNGRGRGLGSLWEYSNLGRVKKNGEIFHPNEDSRYLTAGGDNIHVVIATLFVPNPENKPCVDHINGDKHDNRASNLRWTTYSENVNNPITKPNMIEAFAKSETHKTNISNLGKIKRYGEENGMFNKKHKEESKQLMREHHAGGHKKGEFKQSEESKEKNRIAHLGKIPWNKGLNKEQQKEYILNKYHD